MKLSLTPRELRELVIDGYVKIGLLLHLPDGADCFVPNGTDPKTVVRECIRTTEVFARKEDM